MASHGSNHMLLCIMLYSLPSLSVSSRFPNVCVFVRVVQSSIAALVAKKAKEGIVALRSGVESVLGDLYLAFQGLYVAEQGISALSLAARQYKDNAVYEAVAPYMLAVIDLIYPDVHPNDGRRSTFSNELSAADVGDGSGNASWTMPRDPPKHVPSQRPFDDSAGFLAALQGACPKAIDIGLRAAQTARDRVYAALSDAYVPLVAAREAEERYRALLEIIKQDSNPPAGATDVHLTVRTKCLERQPEGASRAAQAADIACRGCPACAFTGLALPPSAANT